MDKTELLRYFSGSDFFRLLSNGELKLYILLLASADDVDVSCKISFREIEKIGRGLMALKRLKSNMTSLEKYGLAAFEKIEEWPHGELTFRLKRPSIHNFRTDADKKREAIMEKIICPKCKKRSYTAAPQEPTLCPHCDFIFSKFDEGNTEHPAESIRGKEKDLKS